jgi:plasmid stabilization system protein ParE
MTYEVVVTAAAKQDLRSAYLWAAERAPNPAALWLQRLEAELQTQASFPERFQLAPENALVDPEIHQLIFGRRQGAYRASPSSAIRFRYYIFGEQPAIGLSRRIWSPIELLAFRRKTARCNAAPHPAKNSS